ncbi:MAG: YeeE/YedE family protein [Proteobacteria bacterium]|nr:MAG: YeeE/YedE family protein [Pseudomonadota bacterium]
MTWQTPYTLALLGGIIIGASALGIMLYLGRIAGIAGITYGAFTEEPRANRAWRWYFLGGLLLGGFIWRILQPEVFGAALPTPLWTAPAAGLLVGFGVILGSGCTSGHGVCGVSRVAPRSIAATLTFIAAGMVGVFLFRQWGIQ